MFSFTYVFTVSRGFVEEILISFLASLLGPPREDVSRALQRLNRLQLRIEKAGLPLGSERLLVCVINKIGNTCLHGPEIPGANFK